MRRGLAILGILFGPLLAVALIYLYTSFKRSAPSLRISDWAALKVGDRVSDFSLQTVDGATFRLQDHTHKAVLVNFFGSW